MDMNNLPKTHLFAAYIYSLMYNRNDYLLLSLCCRKQGKRGNQKMFDNAGKKCKIIAKVMMVTGAITAILYAIFFIRVGKTHPGWQYFLKKWQNILNYCHILLPMLEWKQTRKRNSPGYFYQDAWSWRFIYGSNGTHQKEGDGWESQHECSEILWV